MAPTLQQAYQRRWWMICTAVVENLFFSAVLLGWPSLFIMLKNECFYSYLCQENATSEQAHKASVATQECPTCTSQDEMLNLSFTIGSFLLSASTLPLGFLMDKYGPRPLRLLGSILFAASCAMMALAGYNPPVLAPLIFPVLSMNGFGGICLTFTSLTLTNMFGNLRSTFLALMIGSYASSAVTFPAIKVIYDAGVSFVTIMLSWSSLACLIFLNCLINWPKEFFSAPEETNHMCKKIKPSGPALDQNVTGDLQQKAPPAQTIPFCHSFCSPIFLWSLVTMGMSQLRIIFYMAAMNKMLEFQVTGKEHASKELKEKTDSIVSFYSSIFGVLQLLCVFSCPFIGYAMDWRMKECVDGPIDRNTDGPSGEKSRQKPKKLRNRKIQKLTNAMRAFVYINLLLVGFGITCMIHSLHLQVNLGLLLFSLVGFFLPIYLFYFRRQVFQKMKDRKTELAFGAHIKLHEDNATTNGALSKDTMA
uniref:Large neutral amino acids transporter small subunit 3-like isoform X2 n=1 Tax=Geotrypetes seraphini TaxID=260995 RepID=A0A6P8NHN2_GEOSA|nr:large neutral amino acids transporter small subunit 3-like isoform X2 [Geotrypetes seraphini]